MNLNNRSEKKHEALPSSKLGVEVNRASKLEINTNRTSELVANETLYEQAGVAMTCRSFEEYCRMFMLQDELPEQGAAVLDVAAGASSFTAELCERGYAATACDPRYALEPDAMHAFGLQELQLATQKLAAKEHAFVWKEYGSLKGHDDIRHQSLEKFSAHYRESYLSGLCQRESSETTSSSYVTASLPRLPFADHQFELVICNHFLFLYQEQFDYTFHLQALTELLRIVKPGGRVLAYPLVGFRNEQYPYLSELQQALAANRALVSLRETSFRFLPAADHFLQLVKLD